MPEDNSVASRFAGWEFFDRRRSFGNLVRFGAGYEYDAGENHYGSGQDVRREVLSHNQPSEQHGDDGIDVRVGSDLGCRHISKQPYIGRESNERAGNDQVTYGFD